jgi:pimeloyl-ACP methyl ester carboxylesterase
MRRRDLSASRLDVEVPGGSLAAFHLNDAGEGAPTVLAVHGITSTSRSWSAVARELGDRASLVAVDLRGRGESNSLPGPFGLPAHARDTVAVLDALGLDRAVLAGHSLGAYVVAHLAAEHPERVDAVVLVDGGLPIPGTEGVDPQVFLDAFLGPALARLQMRFATREEYRAWWRAHPAFSESDVDEDDLATYADYDLVGSEPELRSSVAEDAVRGDAADLFEMRGDAARLRVPATLVVAPRGLLNGPHPMQPLPLAQEWAAEAPDLRRALEVPDVNHYTIALGARGSRTVADTLAAAVYA